MGMDNKFSIVTVVYNDYERILKTIDSVFNQQFTDFEYILIDGGSDDGTIDIICQSKKRFDEKKLSFLYVSEKDRGIYNAMNKAIDQAHGKYVIFLNAGDFFADNTVLEQVNHIIENDSGNAEVIYGNTVQYYDHWIRKEYAKTPDIIKEYMPFCHQSVFVDNQLLKKYKFNEQYRICSDYDMFLRMYHDDIEFKKIDIFISYYSFGGISTGNWGRDLEIEQIIIRNNYGYIDEDEASVLQRKVIIRYRRNLLKQFLKKILPKVIVNKYKRDNMIRVGWKEMI